MPEETLSPGTKVRWFNPHKLTFEHGTIDRYGRTEKYLYGHNYFVIMDDGTKTEVNPDRIEVVQNA